MRKLYTVKGGPSKGYTFYARDHDGEHTDAIQHVKEQDELNGRRPYNYTAEDFDTQVVPLPTDK